MNAWKEVLKVCIEDIVLSNMRSSIICDGSSRYESHGRISRFIHRLENHVQIGKNQLQRAPRSRNISYSARLLRNTEILVSFLRITVRVAIEIDLVQGESMTVLSQILSFELVEKIKEIHLGLQTMNFFNYELLGHIRL